MSVSKHGALCQIHILTSVKISCWILVLFMKILFPIYPKTLTIPSISEITSFCIHFVNSFQRLHSEIHQDQPTCHLDSVINCRLRIIRKTLLSLFFHSYIGSYCLILKSEKVCSWNFPEPDQPVPSSDSLLPPLPLSRSRKQGAQTSEASELNSRG